MITSFSLENFKSFKKLNDFRLSDLTVIAGKNSCGKSSILQSLLLLRQTLLSKTATTLELEGEHLVYTNLKEISYSLPAINQAKIGYSFNVKDSLYDGTVDISFKNVKQDDHYSPAINYLKVKLKDGKQINFQNLKPLNFHEKNDFLDLIDVASAKTVYINFIPTNISSHLKNKKKSTDTPDSILFPLGIFFRDESEVLETLTNDLKNIKYLGPVRATPKRAYVHFSEVARELSPNGENAAHILWARQNESVLFEGEKHRLQDAVNLCIQAMGLSLKITPAKIGNIIYQIKLSQQNGKNEVTITDVGFGYSQVLPIILLCLLTPPGNLIILEQPEIHLHPSSSANLADLFIKFICDGRRILLETHSSELINRLRLRVVEHPILKEKINIAFVESGDIIKNEGSQIKQFKIDENGMFPEWPEGFLDESDKLAESIIKARVGKRLKIKNKHGALDE